MIKSVEFRRKRDKLWQKLEKLLSQTESKGLKSLSPEELEELGTLYRLAASSLHVTRSISLDKNLHHYLESLVTRVYFVIYTRPPKETNPIKHFFSKQFPATVRKYFLYHLIALIIFVLGGIAGFLATLEDPSNYFAFVDQQMAQGRTPFASQEKLAKALQSGQQSDFNAKTLFFASLFTHNTKVGFLSFSFGVALGLPTFFLMVQNGGLLGAMGAAYHIHQLDLSFWAWILPHGITEILAIILCAGSGFILAVGMLRPGKYGRLHNLKIVGQDAGIIVIGTIPMFLIAGIIESFFRQTALPQNIRYAFALTTLLFWIFYLGFVGHFSNLSFKQFEETK